MERRIKRLVEAAAFLLIGLALFQILQQSLVLKNSYVKYRNWKAQETVDLLILGNSHADNGIGPARMEAAFQKDCGMEVSVFNYAVYGMRIEQMYFFVKEILKDHTPKLIVLETYAFCPIAEEDREILARRAFDVMPLSWNKIEAIRYCVTEDRWSYYIPLIKYHTRWKELRPQDVGMLYDASLWDWAGKGAGSSAPETCPDPGDGWFSQAPPALTETRSLNDTETECLERLLALLEEKEIPLVFVSVPFKVQMGLDSLEIMKINHYLLEHYVNGDTVRMLDMNRMWEALDFGYQDLYDEGHVNGSGAAKVTGCLMDFLKESPDLLELLGSGRERLAF